MKITDTRPQATETSKGTQGVGSEPSLKKAKAKESVPPSHGDGVRVTVSEEARKLAAASHATDAAKVERLKAAVADGSFQVDAAAIAKKIVGGSDE